jgi:hypothetical protein
MYGFFSYQFWLSVKNTTTYESHKWSDISEHVRAQDRLRKAGKLPPPPASLPPGPKKVQDLTEKDLINVYDRGLRNNLEEVFYFDDWKGMDGTQINIDVFYNKAEESAPSPNQDSNKKKK